MPANLRKLLEWLDGVSPLLETQIVAAGLSHTLDKALMRNFAEMNLRETTVSITARGRDALSKFPVSAFPPARASAIGRPLPLCPLTAAADLFNRRCRMVLGAPVSGLAAGLAFDGSTSGPVTMKLPLIMRMVNVVIASVSCPNPPPPRASLPALPHSELEPVDVALFSLFEGGWRMIRHHRPGLRALQASVAERQVVLPLSERGRPCPRSTNITRTREIAFGGPLWLGPKSSESGS